MRDPARPLSIPEALEAGLAAQRQGRLDDAKAIYEAVLGLSPRNFDALHLLGVVRHRQGRNDEAVALIEAALAEQPSVGLALNNLGNALRGSRRFAEAVVRYDAAVRLLPPRERATVMVNRGLAFSGMAREREAADDYREAQSLDPDNVDAHFADAVLRLARGDFEAGWRLYEWRWGRPGVVAPHERVTGTQWTGKEPVRGRRIRIAHEQGFGDTMMMARYVPMIEALGATVELSVPAPLEALMRESFPMATLVPADRAPACDLFCPAMSLPLAFGTTLASIPATPAYLKPPADRVAKWRSWFGDRNGPRVGIAWSGNPRHEDDHNRSLTACPLPALRVEGVGWFSLQRDPREGDAAALARHGARNAAAGFADFADTAAAILQLDLVITVDSAVAHLAGALGKPVWILLPAAADWRWLRGRRDSPWYPSATLFRQPAYGDWASVLAEVHAALREHIGGLRSP